MIRGYVGAAVPEVYRELFAAIAATAGSLTGLLFVALSVTNRARAAGPSDIQQQFGWQSVHPGLIADLDEGHYFKDA